MVSRATGITIPGFDASNIGQGLHVISDGAGGVQLAWAADSGATGTAPSGGSFDASSASGGGRGQVIAFSSDGSYVNSVGDQGGSNHCADYTGLFKWAPTNNAATDQNRHRAGQSIAQDPYTPTTWYKICSDFFTSQDGGVTWTIDTSAGAPSHSQDQQGLTASANPRAIGQMIVVNNLHDVIVGTDTGIARKVKATGVWDTANFPRSDGQALCVFQNPGNKNEVWAIIAVNGGTYNSYLYRCSDISVASPTWVGPFTGGTAFTGAGATFYPQEGRFCSANGSIIVLSVNPQAVNANATKEAIEHGIYVLNARTNTLSATWTQLGASVTPLRSALSSRTLVSLNTRTVSGTCQIVACFTNVSNTTVALRGQATGDFLSTNLGTFVGISASQTNLINGVTAEPWCVNPAGVNAAAFGTTGLTYADIDPTNLDHVIFGGRQGYYRSVNFTAGSPAIYPIPHGAGGPVVPSAVWDPNNSSYAYIGTSDNCMVPTYDGALDPGITLGITHPADAGSGTQIHGSNCEVLSDGSVVIATQDYGFDTNYGVWVHPGISANAWPSGDAGWVNQNFHGGTSMQDGSTISNVMGYFGLAAWKNTTPANVIVAVQGTNGWWRKVGAAAPVRPTTPPLLASSTTISGAQTAPGSGTYSLGVASTAGFTSPAGSLLADGQVIFYTGITGNTFTGCRQGYSHTFANGSSVRGIVNPSAYTDFAVVGDGDGHIACYADAGGVYVSSDYGDNWSIILSGTLGTIPSNLRNFAGFCAFKPGDSTTLYVATDSHIYMIKNPYTTPVSYDITGTVTMPGPMDVSATQILIHNRNTASQNCQLFHAPFPVGTPPAVPAWTAYQDPTGRYAGQAVFCRKLSVNSAGDVLASAQGGGTCVFRVTA